ncbi:hypothetical protein [Borrelia hermsii]|nr:hypothetical protein [Borrelia hermsii]UPA08716.1 hypothetical protein bhDAH_001462 [Borrelia hermsii DAH]UVY98946.1 hypothetical protein K9R62_B290 [Borrelia hermsii]
MMEFNDDFEDVLFSKRDESGYIVFSKLGDERFAMRNAKLCLDVFTCVQ